MSSDPKPLWNELERSIHEPARLALVTTLCASEGGMSFQDLKAECGLTDGNLSRHLKVLEEAGIIRVQKAGKGRSSRTRVSMSGTGRDAFMNYLHSLEKVLQGALQPGGEGIGESAGGLSLAVS